MAIAWLIPRSLITAGMSGRSSRPVLAILPCRWTAGCEVKRHKKDRIAHAENAEPLRRTEKIATKRKKTISRQDAKNAKVEEEI